MLANIILLFKHKFGIEFFFSNAVHLTKVVMFCEKTKILIE